MSRLAAALLLALAFASHAGQAPPAADNPALEKRTTALAEQLRCLVCQNQTIADSNAGLAVDLRNQIREQLAKGATDRDVIDYMVARYGEFVLYNPPFRAATVLLWLGPLLLVLGGLVWLFGVLRARRKDTPPELTDEERRRARELLERGAE